MALHTNIQNIINKNVVESVRVECKTGWNPNDVIHSITAFANDIDNFSGGYIIIGARFNEELDRYEFKDMSNKDIDEIQKSLTEYCLKCIEPKYVPVSDVMEYDGKRFLVIWAYAGYDRPYRCPTDVYNLKGKKSYYIKKGSTTIAAIGNTEKLLLELSVKEPFDDRINYHASLDDISLDLIKEYIHRTGSDLSKVIFASSKESICRDLRIIGGPNEAIRPRNIGLLMFSLNPEKFIPYAYIDLVIINDPTGRDIFEKRFIGSLVAQYDAVMQFIKNNVIDKKTIKVVEETESKVVYNYPFEAIDEIVQNAILHKDYQEYNPISIRIEKDFIQVTSYPGFEPGIKDNDVANFVIKSDRYRNRRIAEMLKELHIVEAHNTGFPTILDACDNNDSDYPVFISDDDRSFLTVRLNIHRAFLNENRERRNLEKDILDILEKGSFTLSQLSRSLGYEQITGALKRNLKIMISKGLISYNGKLYNVKK